MGFGHAQSNAARIAGVRDGLAQAGIDNIPYGELSAPTLTSVDTQSETIGEVAMQKRVDMLGGKDHIEHVTIEPCLIVRDSTAVAEGR
ncbi:substrate-binding domain-containing protein [Caballeronia sp. LZ034LL]|nr:substrate-binding domain-containing protein [Caballeronia sp. LZ034LL]